MSRKPSCLISCHQSSPSGGCAAAIGWQGRAKLAGMRRVGDIRAPAAQRIVGAGGSLTRLAELQPSLEEVYTRYFEEARRAA